MLEFNPCMGLPLPPAHPEKLHCQGQCCVWRSSGAVRGMDARGGDAVAAQLEPCAPPLQVERLARSAASGRFSAKEMCHRFVYRDNYGLRARAQQLFLEPLFTHAKDLDAVLSEEEQRAATLRRMARLAQEMPFSVSDLMKYVATAVHVHSPPRHTLQSVSAGHAACLWATVKRES